MNAPVSTDRIDKAWAHGDRQPRIAIIGAGFSGVASIIKCARPATRTSPASSAQTRHPDYSEYRLLETVGPERNPLAA